MKKCFIIGAGEFEPLRGMSFENAFIACADGGADNAKKLLLTPDVVIGDNDSVCCNYENKITYPTKKDETDTLLCVNYCYEKGFDDFTFLFCTGGRLDHFFANAAILEYLADKKCAGKIINSKNEITFLKKGSVEFENTCKYKYFSIFSIDESAEITISGAEYNVEKFVLKRSLPIAVSNSVVKKAKIITKNKILIVRSSD